MSRLLFILILLLFGNLSGQVFSADRRYTPSSYSAEIVDSSEIVVLYNIVCKTGNGKSISAQAMLQIGANFSKFVDTSTLERDPILSQYSKLKSLGVSELNKLSNLNVIYNKNILKNFLSRKILYQEKIAKNVYEYEEPYPEQNWILKNEDAVILGNRCKSATLSFRGRNYAAWYTPEVPKNDGPAHFFGVPGLILRISEDKGEYNFSAVAIEKKSMNIYLKNEKAIIHANRADFRKIQKNYFENPGLFLHGKAYDSQGNEIVPKVLVKIYNPLELE